MNETQQELQKYGMIRERPEIKISFEVRDGKHIARISGIPSGIEIDALSDDNLQIVARWAESRFKRPVITQS